MGILYNVFIICTVISTGIPGLLFVIQTRYLGGYTEELPLLAVIDSSRLLCTVSILITFCIDQEKITSIMNKLSKVAEISTEMRLNKTNDLMTT